MDTVSHSPFWPNTAILVTEDDAQNGPDHVDAHRTLAYVISPYTQTARVDSTHYDTASMVATVESLLNLPPISNCRGIGSNRLPDTSASAAAGCAGAAGVAGGGVGVAGGWAGGFVCVVACACAAAAATSASKQIAETWKIRRMYDSGRYRM